MFGTQGPEVRILSLRPSPTRPAIVIFGAAVRAGGEPSGTLRRRTEAAARYGARLGSPLYIPTGGIGRHGPSEAVVMRRLLIARGVPAADILAEETGTDTLSSVRAVLRLLWARGHRGPVLVATSAYHLPRCLLLLRLAGCPARACTPPDAPAAPGWRRWYWRLREAPALPYDAVLVLWLRLMRRL